MDPVLDFVNKFLISYALFTLETQHHLHLKIINGRSMIFEHVFIILMALFMDDFSNLDYRCSFEQDFDVPC